MSGPTYNDIVGYLDVIFDRATDIIDEIAELRQITSQICQECAYAEFITEPLRTEEKPKKTEKIIKITDKNAVIVL